MEIGQIIIDEGDRVYKDLNAEQMFMNAREINAVTIWLGMGMVMKILIRNR